MSKKFDFKSYLERKKVNANFVEKLKEIKERERFFANHFQAYKDSCTHDLILKLGKESYFVEDTGYAVCLCCGEVFHLKYYRPDEIPNEKIIDAVGVVPEDYFYTICGTERVLVTRAKQKLDELANDELDLHIDVLKQTILDDLILYSKEKKQSREEFLARTRKREN